jgi:hypothetical protein
VGTGTTAPITHQLFCNKQLPSFTDNGFILWKQFYFDKQFFSSGYQMESPIKMCFRSSTARIPAGVTRSELKILVTDKANVTPLIHAH